MKTLTPKQEKYCVLRASGVSQIIAYKTSYNTTSDNTNSLSVTAHKLENNPKIALRIRELQNAFKNSIQDEYKWEKEQVTRETLRVMKSLEMQQPVVSRNDTLDTFMPKHKRHIACAKTFLECIRTLNKVHGLI